MTTELEWLTKIPRVKRALIVGRSIERLPRVKEIPGEENVLVRSMWIQHTPLYVIVITRVEMKWRLRMWLRNIDRTLLLILDEQPFTTVRGAEHRAWCKLRDICNDMRASDKKFEEEVEAS
jgi:hypothetical protein